MIIEKASVDTYLDLVAADADGFMLDNTDGQQVWLSYDQLDDVVRLTSTLRLINAADAKREEAVR